jgi:hypothetical protein
MANTIDSMITECLYYSMSSSAPAPVPGNEGPLSGELQFEHAEALPAPATGPQCVACKQHIAKTYYHAQGMVVCETCAQRIQAGQQAPPVASLGKAALYGVGAALAGCAIYALTAILLNLEIGLIAILVGYMVGRAIRHGSRGLGGRPQQIMAVVLTYFAITSSYIPVFIYQIRKNPAAFHQAEQKQRTETPVVQEQKPKPSVAQALFFLFLLFAAAPFLSLTQGMGALITLFIIFIGLRQAWRLTGRSDLLVMGPYELEPAA